MKYAQLPGITAEAAGVCAHSMRATAVRRAAARWRSRDRTPTLRDGWCDRHFLGTNPENRSDRFPISDLAGKQQVKATFGLSMISALYEYASVVETATIHS
jgi:hypothetical protein